MFHVPAGTRLGIMPAFQDAGRIRVAGIEPVDRVRFRNERTTAYPNSKPTLRGRTRLATSLLTDAVTGDETLPHAGPMGLTPSHSRLVALTA